MNFDQAEYWRTRHETYKGDPRSVGNLAQDRASNEAGERELKIVVREVAKRLGGRTVLDLGCGYGRIAPEFVAEGYAYRGLDVSPTAVATARETVSGAAEFAVADLNAWEADATYDVVCALYIFVHFVDDGNWRRILEMALRSVAPGGSLIVADHFPTARATPGVHVTTRAMQDYKAELARLGFDWAPDFNADLVGALPENPHARQFHRIVRAEGAVAVKTPAPEPARAPAPARPDDLATSLELRQSIKRGTPKVELGLEHTRNCAVVPTREVMLDRMKKGGVVAEVGVAFGDFTREIMARTAPAEINLIDLWSSERYRAGLERILQSYPSEVAENRMRVHQGYSTERLPEFPDGYFDWIYIDTDHSYLTTRDELRLAARKVKPDGRIAGHDFTSGNSITPWPYGVIEACNEMCVNEHWEYEFLTLEPHGHFSFCLRKIGAAEA